MKDYMMSEFFLLFFLAGAWISIWAYMKCNKLNNQEMELIPDDPVRIPVIIVGQQILNEVEGAQMQFTLAYADPSYTYNGEVEIALKQSGLMSKSGYVSAEVRSALFEAVQIYIKGDIEK